MVFKMKGFSGFGNSIKKGTKAIVSGGVKGSQRKAVTEKPKTEGKEIKIKTDSSKLYGLDWKGFEPSVTE